MLRLICLSINPGDGRKKKRKREKEIGVRQKEKGNNWVIVFTWDLQ